MTEQPDVPPQTAAADQPPAQPAAPPDGWDEDLYQATATVLAEPEQAASPANNLGCLILSLVLFVAAMYGSSWKAVGLIVGVLLLHELGHFVGMRLFGYSNLRMFFIPFFGAAVSGRKHAAPAWQQGTVLLLGPLPGILLGLGLQLWLRPDREDLPGELVTMLVLINAFNLLPLIPLDGGRLIDLLFFARRPLLASLFTLFAALCLGALALAAGSWLLGGFAALVGLATPARYRQVKLQRALRDNKPEWPDQLEQMSDSQRRDLFGWARLLNPLDRQPASVAASMRNLHEAVVSRRPGVAAWALLLLFYLAGFAVSVGTLTQSFRDTDRAREARAERLADEAEQGFRELARLQAAQAGEGAPVKQSLRALFEAAPPGVRERALNVLFRRALVAGDQNLMLAVVTFRREFAPGEDDEPPAGE
jgi:hypothetical protein